jgi:hypothetical protein
MPKKWAKQQCKRCHTWIEVKINRPRKAPRLCKKCKADDRRAVNRRTAARRKEDRTLARKPRRCEICGELFQPSRDDARFCCDAHRQQAYRQRRGASAAR